eukprot:18982-Heterococcus_DN1.PRE.3
MMRALEQIKCKLYSCDSAGFGEHEFLLQHVSTQPAGTTQHSGTTALRCTSIAAATATTTATANTAAAAAAATTTELLPTPPPLPATASPAAAAAHCAAGVIRKGTIRCPRQPPGSYRSTQVYL